MNRIYLALLATILSACSMAFGPRFNPVDLPSEKSLIYVYRMPTISGIALSAKPMIVVDGNEYRTIKIGGYFPIQIEPGHHEIGLKSSLFGQSVGELRKVISFEVAPGQVKYFEYAQITTGYNRYGGTEVAEVEEHFVEVPPLYGEKMIKKTKWLSYD